MADEKWVFEFRGPLELISDREEYKCSRAEKMGGKPKSSHRQYRRGEDGRLVWWQVECWEFESLGEALECHQYYRDFWGDWRDDQYEGREYRMRVLSPAGQEERAHTGAIGGS